MKIGIEINDCWQCPFVKSEQVYTSDSFEMVFKLTCTKSNNKVVSNYREANDPKFIPDWCPQKIQE